MIKHRGKMLQYENLSKRHIQCSSYYFYCCNSPVNLKLFQNKVKRKRQPPNLNFVCLFEANVICFGVFYFKPYISGFMWRQRLITGALWPVIMSPTDSLLRIMLDHKKHHVKVVGGEDKCVCVCALNEYTPLSLSLLC